MLVQTLDQRQLYIVGNFIIVYRYNLQETGYKHKLVYNPRPPLFLLEKDLGQNNKHGSTPPGTKFFLTNVGGNFFKIVDPCFPCMGQPLRPIFNWNTLRAVHK